MKTQRPDLSSSTFGNHRFGSHAMWIERPKETRKDHPEQSCTVEIACSRLKKAAVCWVIQAADETALTVFEQGAVPE